MGIEDGQGVPVFYKWITDAVAFADEEYKNDNRTRYIYNTGEYTNFPGMANGYIIVEEEEKEELDKEYDAMDTRYLHYDDKYCLSCLYSTEIGAMYSLEPQRSEVEHFMAPWYTEYYQRDVPRGDDDFGLGFFIKVTAPYSKKVDNLLEQAKKRELAENHTEDRYQKAIENAIDNYILDVYYDIIETVYQQWRMDTRDVYTWIGSMNRVGKSGGHLLIVMNGPEDIYELQERVKDCEEIQKEIDDVLAMLNSEGFWLEEYGDRFDIEMGVE